MSSVIQWFDYYGHRIISKKLVQRTQVIACAYENYSETKCHHKVNTNTHYTRLFYMRMQTLCKYRTCSVKNPYIASHPNISY